ncbi:hypothetical protein PI124_g8904 [Phytophthora idaei]|nr:hypothetical protein PI125_g13125 [Phytophthora idaei]KAG3149136.1 hypothetical protein PI126_g12155 [Phytophthora idaei]KAG3246390.1 hypothetical protein PI124_g8904 [Phytophthora idaei]
MKTWDREESTPPTEAKAESREKAVLSAGSRGVARPLSRNLADELSAVVGPDAADDDWGEEEKEDEPSSKAVRVSDGLAVRPPVNGDTPAANKVLARCFEKMQSSDWIRQFNPRQTRQATWGDLRDELAYPVNSLSTTQVVEDTVSLLRAMGMDVRNYPSTLTLKEWSPSEAGADLHKWKKKVRTAFGVIDISKGRQPVSRVAVQAANPAMVPLPETSAKVGEGSRDFIDNVFSKGEESPYFQDSHMVTPRSTNRARRHANDCDGSHAGRSVPRSSRGLEDDGRATVTTTIRQTATMTSGTKSTMTRVKSWFDRWMPCAQQIRPTPDQGSSWRRTYRWTASNSSADVATRVTTRCND